MSIVFFWIGVGAMMLLGYQYVQTDNWLCVAAEMCVGVIALAVKLRGDNAALK